MSITTTTPHRVPVYSPLAHPYGTCGHRIRGDPVLNDRLWNCPHRIAAAQGTCGIRQYLLRVWLMGEPWIMAMRAAGWKVYRVGQYNAERTQDPGPADTICFHEARRLFAFVEWKRPVGGQQSEHQREFHRLCEAVGVRYVLASRVSDVETLHRERE